MNILGLNDSFDTTKPIDDNVIRAPSAAVPVLDPWVVEHP
ncbi:hypothetical protein DB30_04228 [Enhygromyxa salina]|uniref:Uncharacterized protein n=1 Tax=Enhygromyxa salina TaxID=215803 RepID=A0A0C1ZG54_9BACT|nr:hypothetical protein DB30_04228 [Enhygromyxa salina]